MENDSYGKHEVLHTASIVGELIYTNLLEHGAVQANPVWRAKAEELNSVAFEFYQMVGKDAMARHLDRLKEIIIAKSFRKGDFTLVSGARSDYFFDLKQTMADPEGISLIAAEIMHELINLGLCDLDAIGGIALGAVPIVSVVSAKSFDGHDGLPCFFVRKETKDHGTGQTIEGNLVAGQKVVLVEDVTTTGGSLLAAVLAVRAIGCHITDAITVVDREEGAVENLHQHGVTLHALFTKMEFE